MPQNPTSTCLWLNTARSVRIFVVTSTLHAVLEPINQVWRIRTASCSIPCHYKVQVEPNSSRPASSALCGKGYICIYRQMKNRRYYIIRIDLSSIKAEVSYIERLYRRNRLQEPFRGKLEQYIQVVSKRTSEVVNARIIFDRNLKRRKYGDLML